MKLHFLLLPAALCAAPLLLPLRSPAAAPLPAPADAPATSSAPAAAAAATARILAAANAFLATLDDAQRAKVTFKFEDAAQRVRWSNLPTGIVERRGLRMGDLKPAQNEAIHTLLAAALSPMGLEKVTGIIDADETLRQTDGGGGRLMFGKAEFYISFLGAPSATEPWIIQFGGHHLAVNLTIVGDRDTLTPTLTAVQPSTFTKDGKTVRPLGRENDKAFALVNALDEAQKKQAILGFQMRDLVLGPGQDGRTVAPEGIKASALNPAQQQQLLDLAREWVGIIHESAAEAKMAELKAQLSDTWFSWSGPTQPGSAAYFRIQSPTLFIEYAPQRMGGDATKHIHTMYRDPQNDYGKKFLAK